MRVKLADFGDVGGFPGGRDLTLLGSLTPEYVTRGQLNLKTDSWGVGVCLYEMLYGEHPFRQARDTFIMRVKQAVFSLPLSGCVSIECRNLLKGLLTLDSEARLAVEGALALPLLARVQFEPTRLQRLLPEVQAKSELESLVEDYSEVRHNYVMQVEEIRHYGLGYVNSLGQVGVIG
jgi:serine/threonine protein kinase